jgi:hypothetical protein
MEEFDMDVRPFSRRYNRRHKDYQHHLRGYPVIFRMIVLYLVVITASIGLTLAGIAFLVIHVVSHQWHGWQGTLFIIIGGTGLTILCPWMFKNDTAFERREAP